MIRILKYGQAPASEVFARPVPKEDVSVAVASIIADVRARGDEALRDCARKYDKAELSEIEVSAAEFQTALSRVDPGFLAVLRRAAANIRKFHARQVRSGFIISDEPGIVIGQRIVPLDRVGLYVPGGTAAYPSTVLMDAIPAKLAGVPELVAVTPPRPDGCVDPAILAAASVAGVDRVFKSGGAQAVAALAYGTESVPRVDKIVGPGNAWVAEAKKQVFGTVAIDMIAGPSEILVVADGGTNPVWCAADMLSQAEHDRLARAVLITDSPNLASAVRAEIERQLPLLERAEIARASIENMGAIIVAPSIEQAIDIANEIAPEHLELCVASPFGLLGRVRHAGSVFLGRCCPEALGDYLAGPNHTLPTGGTARFSSPLSVDDFVKKSQYTYYTREALSACARDIASFARAEGLTGHAASVLARTEEAE